MVEAIYSKLDIACQHLDAAADMYVAKQNYPCAIHLAGAASELLDRHLPESKRPFEIARRAQIAMHQAEMGREPSWDEVNDVLNGVKNAVKHMSGRHRERTVTLDPVEDAQWWIDQALNSFEKLNLRKTPSLWRYIDLRNAEIRR